MTLTLPGIETRNLVIIEHFSVPDVRVIQDQLQTMCLKEDNGRQIHTGRSLAGGPRLQHFVSAHRRPEFVLNGTCYIEIRKLPVVYRTLYVP